MRKWNMLRVHEVPIKERVTLLFWKLKVTSRRRSLLSFSRAFDFIPIKGKIYKGKFYVHDSKARVRTENDLHNPRNLWLHGRINYSALNKHAKSVVLMETIRRFLNFRYVYSWSQLLMRVWAPLRQDNEINFAICARLVSMNQFLPHVCYIYRVEEWTDGLYIIRSICTHI